MFVRRAIQTTYYISHNSSNKRHDVKPNTLNRKYVNWTSGNRTRNSVQNERAATDGHHVIPRQSASHWYVPSPHPIICANDAALTTKSCVAKRTEKLVEKKRHLKVCEENFWGMVLIKQMLDIISCEIWNVFSRQAFACRARGRDTVRATASAMFCKSGIKVRWALHIAAASQVCTTQPHGTSLSNASGTQPLVLLISAALRSLKPTYIIDKHSLSTSQKTSRVQYSSTT